MFFIGDSSTRGLVLPLMTLLDNEQTHPYDMVTWYNVTDTEDEASNRMNGGRWWRGHGSDFYRLDYVFRRSWTGRWKVFYKKASFLYSWDRLHRPGTGHYPKVFLSDYELSGDEARISFQMARGTGEVRLVWEHQLLKYSARRPDVVYANVGHWGMGHVCEPGIIDKINSAMEHFIWGTKQNVTGSKCDEKVSKLDHVTVLDRTLCPTNTELNKLRLVTVHYGHVVNYYDLMQMFYLLGWEQKKDQLNVEFSPFCTVVSKSRKHDRDKLIRLYNVTVPMPDQHWKNAWKLPCRYTVL